MSFESGEILVQIGRSRQEAPGAAHPRIIRADTALEVAIELLERGHRRILMIAPPDLGETLKLIDLARNVLHLPLVAIDTSGDASTERCLRLAGVSEYHCGSAARAMIERLSADAEPASPDESGVFLLLRQDGEGPVNRIAKSKEA